MSGEGGDAVLLAPDAYLIDVFKRGQLGTFLQHTYGRARLNLISPLTLIKSLIKLHRTSYRQWLHQQTQKLSDQSLRILPLMYQQLGVGYMMSWDFVPHIGKWYTDQLVDSVVSELEQWSTDANPFAESPWKNEFMAEIFLTGFATRTIQQMSDQFDVNLEFPYLDSLVIDTCLSARPEERTTPFTYKPLLTKALSNDIPSSIFIRMTKGDYTSDEFAGLQKNLSSMKTLLKNSLLADRGLIDLAEYHAGLERHMITGIDTNSSHLNQTLAVELWLRQLMNANDNFWMHEN
jgi:asparagine synthase (glutamine-hydrolysing)